MQPGHCGDLGRENPGSRWNHGSRGNGGDDHDPHSDAASALGKLRLRQAGVPYNHAALLFLHVFVFIACSLLNLF